MGPSQSVLQEATALLDPQILWRQNRPVLLLAGLLHENAGHSVDCGHVVLLVRTGHNGQRVQYAEQGDLRLRRRGQYDPLSVVRPSVQLPEVEVSGNRKVKVGCLKLFALLCE